MQSQFLTPFIGRERELAEIRHLMASTRLVTITGAGGSGKTRLASEVASAVSGAYSAGVHFISLGAIIDPTLLIPSIARAVGLAESPDQLLFDSLKEFLRDSHALLVLDNFEQLISAAPLLSELLLAARNLSLLVTSREALRLRGEQEYPLDPLELFIGELNPEQPPLELLAQCPSVALFVDRAKTSQPEFRLTPANALSVAELCGRLDGLPLAIELAAARIRLLPPDALLAQLRESSLGLLTSGARDLPARQQTLRAAIQWSYDLLESAEKRIFRWLSVYSGGCDLAAVAASGVEQSQAAVLGILDSLIHKSLVIRDESAGEPRLRLLETIREFGEEQLSGMGEVQEAQRKHADYYLSLAEDAEPHLMGAEQKEWLNRLELEQDNLRVALRWGLESHEETRPEERRSTFVLRLTGALWRFWYLRGRWAEGRRWLEQALVEASNEPANKPLRAKVLYGAATIIRRQNDLARARALCEQSVALSRELGDKSGLLGALLQLIRILDFQGDYEGMGALLAEAWKIAEDLPDLPIKAQAYLELSFIDASSIRTGVAAGYIAESERIYRVLDNPAGLATALFMRASIAEFQGDPASAEVQYAEAERLAADVDDEPLKGRILSRHIVSNWQRGDYATARRLFEQFLYRSTKDRTVDVRRLTSTGQSSFIFGVLAAVLYEQGLPTWAARVFGLIDSLGDASQPSSMMLWEVLSPFRDQIAGVRKEVRAQLGKRAFEEALAEGRAMTLDDILVIPRPVPAETAAAVASLREPLSPREIEVLRLLVERLSNPQIAARLVISRRTVDAHLRSIYDKLGVHSRDAAVRTAMEKELLHDELSEE